MKVLRIVPGKFLNSPNSEMAMTCPDGTFHGFCLGYLKGLEDIGAGETGWTAAIGKAEMIVKFNYGTRIYRLQNE